jgi:lipopolysaccharide cholinephosphotransferase
MTPTQKHLLKLLVEIDEICKKHDIEFFLDYGTVIGAVRHEGFIPWDNDLDITMTEPNYNKFVEVCEKELDGKTRIFRDNRRDREYPSVFGRYIDLECSRISPSFPFWKPDCGQVIDIFCLMELPKDEVKKNEAIERFFAYDEFSNISFRHYRKKTDGIMKRYKKYRRLSKIVGREKVLSSLEKKIFNQHYDDCDTYISSSARFVGPKTVIPKYFYNNPIEVDFEGHKFKMSDKYIEVMRYHYGETYYLLPEDKRIHAEMTHTGIPEAEYFNDYKEYINKPSLLKHRLKAKNNNVEEGYLTYKWNLNFYQALIYKNAYVVRKNLQNRMSLTPTEAQKIKDRKELEKINNILADYFYVQMHSSVRSWNLYTPVDDDIFELAVYIMLYYKNDFNGARKMFNLRIENGYDLTPTLKTYLDALDSISDFKKFYFYKDFENAGKILDHAMQNYPEIKEIKLSQLEYLCAVGEYDKAGELCEKLLSEYPGNDACEKALGDIAYDKKDYEEAKKHYDFVMENSANGFYHLDIRKRMEAIG